MYKNYVFDVYGTLVDIHTNEYEISTWQKMADTLRFYGAEYSAEELSETYFSACELQMITGKARFKHPEVDVVEVFRQIFANRGKKAGKSLATHLAQEFRAFSTEYLKLYDGVTETLAKLKKAGKKLYILSNAQSCFTKTEIAKLGLRKYFSGIVYSSDVGCAKPDAKIFDFLVNKYGLNKKETVYVGNDAYTDVTGARNGKIDCLWIKTNLSEDREPTVAPKYRIDDGNFREIAKLLLK
ncbi:MAG: HAD family hydrolase [Corallococcus sp.]|nr:HAD family hydrolase [Corallococcus sp.]MCM1359077.1 HAD family hydrolase [Corallococcus sp.]MCM1395066.1 HAD family hydrolase [Corallococcus sp.]